MIDRALDADPLAALHDITAARIVLLLREQVAIEAARNASPPISWARIAKALRRDRDAVREANAGLAPGKTASVSPYRGAR